MSETPGNSQETIAETTRLNTDAYNCRLYRTRVVTESRETKSIIYKELQEDTFMFENYPAETLEEKASKIRSVFSVIKEYIGEEVVDTDIRVGVGHEGIPCIILTQEEVVGKGLEEGSLEYKTFSQTKKPLLQEKLNKALEDPKIIGIEGIEDAVDWIRADAMGAPKNIILTPDGQYRLIDVV